MSLPGLTLVIPFYNEQGNLLPLARELEQVLDGVIQWECIWIDDGSTDAGPAEVEELAGSDKRHRILRLRQNSGQSAALLAGFAASRAPLLATLDADGQNNPDALPEMIRLLQGEGFDAVNGYRAKRRDSVIRLASSRIANGCRNAITGRTVRDVGCSLRVFRRECVRHLPPFRGVHRFLPTLFVYAGFRITEVPCRHRARSHGQSKYGIGNRLWVGLADLVGVFWLRKRFACYRIQAEESL